MKIKHPIALALGIGTASAASVVTTAAAEQHGQQHAPVTKSLQEHPLSAQDPQLRAFYQLLVDARGRGAEAVDAELEKKVRELARGQSPGHGLDATGWENHVVDMAGQMLAVGKTDPKVFQSYEQFVVGLRGPE